MDIKWAMVLLGGVGVCVSLFGSICGILLSDTEAINLSLMTGLGISCFAFLALLVITALEVWKEARG